MALQIVLSLLILCYLDIFTNSFRIRFNHKLWSRHTQLYEVPTSTSTSTSKSFEQSYIDQKNYIILEKLRAASNLTEAASSFVNFCDQSFDNFLQEKISQLPTEEAKQKLGKIRYEINSARQRKLREADQMLRGILQAGALKPMEAKLMYHLKRNEIDMAFMVILQLNIEDAMGKSETAFQIMTHLRTIITEYQDNMVAPPVRLMRLLIRTDDSEKRREILRQKLLVDENLKLAYYSKQEALGGIGMPQSSCCAGTGRDESCSSQNQLQDHSHDHDNKNDSSSNSVQQQKKVELTALANAQCEHIVIEENLPIKTQPAHSDQLFDHEHSHEHSHEHDTQSKSYGPADVDVQSLIDTILDVQMQMCDNNSVNDVTTINTDTTDSVIARTEMLRKCEELREDLYQVLVKDFQYQLSPKQSILVKAV